MSREKQDGPPPRDTTLARLVASALQSQTLATSGAACPDADLLSAYAEHALNSEEAARWESHFADCARCRQVLAVLTVSAEDSLTQQEIARLGQIVGKAVAPSEAAVPALEISRQSNDSKAAAPPKHHVPWRWLVPAFGVAAVAALWFGLRPTLPSIAPVTQITAEKVAVPPPRGQESQMAQANVPPSPTAPMSPAGTSATNAPVSAVTAGKEVRNLDREALPPAEAPAKQKDTLHDGAGSGPRDEDKRVTPAAQVAEADRVAPAAPPPIPRSTNQTVTVTGEAPVVETANGAAGAPAPAPPPPATKQAEAAQQTEVARQPQAPQPNPSSAARPSAGNAVSSPPLAARNTMAAMAKTAAPPVVFGTPDRGVEWRISLGGRIERSTDQGKTWQLLPSGVTSNLIAGTAVSNKVAWIVGRAGVILRTTDGEHWQRAAPPPAPPVNGSAGGSIGGRVDAVASAPDWSGVQASDALHATINSADGRRYATSDGGRTWTLQP